MKIYSTIQPNKLLHIIIRKRDVPEGRVNVIPANEFLQMATLRLPKDTTFKPHKHNLKPVEPMAIAQESWVVMSGAVRVVFYDLDDTIMHEDLLTAGDVSITLAGGHNYIIAQDETRVLEFKTGPYENQEIDKTFI